MALPTITQRSHTACPYCFVDLDLKHVAFRCSGRPAASSGRRCVPHPDPVRRDVLGDASPVLPPVLEQLPDGRVVVDDDGRPELHRGRLGSQTVCNRCGGATAQCICPGCHSLLPDELSSGAVSLGVVGARNSGKTVLLALMEQQLMTRMPERFQAAIDHPGGTVGLANDLGGFREAMQRHDQDAGRLPNQTTSTGGTMKAPSVYRWKRISGGAQIISVYDTAGEDVANRDLALAQQHLGASTAILLVIDPFSLSENRGRAMAKGMHVTPEHVQMDVLDGLTTLLRQSERGRGVKGGQKIVTPVAVAVTKMDAFWDEERALNPRSPLLGHADSSPFFDETASREAHDYLAAKLNEWGGASLVNKMETEFATFRLFPVSALGAEPVYGRGVLSSDPSPSGVVDPLLWVLHIRKFVPGPPSQKRGVAR